ncbi:MAG: FAD-dependent monooxygenase [Pseudomonadales bacterium]|nr:FAD-dependent monooxygenase [Pseudomonadales bacterium]
MSLHIGIVGGGIGGLCTAIALRAIGLQVSLYEQSDSAGEYGAGIQLSPNATRIFKALGLLDAIETVSFKPQNAQLRSWKNARLIASVPLGQTSLDRYGSPYLHIHRSNLHDILRQRAQSAGVHFRFAHRLVDLSQQDDHVSLAFANGKLYQHELIIGCDGIKSAVRNLLFDNTHPQFSGHVAWRGLIKTNKLPDNLIAPNATVHLGPHQHFVHYYLGSGDYVNFVAVLDNQDWQQESWSIPADKKALECAFSGWNTPVQTLIKNIDVCYMWALFHHSPLKNWTDRRITLLGDACHPMLPYMAQGAAMAIEDAWVLSRLLEQKEQEPRLALAEYQKYRLARTAKVQAASEEQGNMFHLADRTSITFRNLKLGLGSRYLPDLALQSMDWIYGYDAVKGFH